MQPLTLFICYRARRACRPLPLLPRFHGSRRVGRRCLGAVDGGQNNGEPKQHVEAQTVSSQLCQPGVTRRQGLSRLRFAASLTVFSQMASGPHVLWAVPPWPCSSRSTAVRTARPAPLAPCRTNRNSRKSNALPAVSVCGSMRITARFFRAVPSFRPRRWRAFRRP